MDRTEGSVLIQIDQGAAVARTNILGEFPYFGAPHADPIVD
jgi:hypothetical protein